MRIERNTFAVFWTRPGLGRAFHADGYRYDPADTPETVANRFREMFPDSVIRSMRDGSGRFVAFKAAA